MEGHVQDRWWKVVREEDGTTRKEKTTRYGTGKRYRLRYVDDNGKERSESFPDGSKGVAERRLVELQADLLRGTYLDPNAGKTLFGEYAREWLDAQTFDIGTRQTTELRIRLHILPTFKRREIAHIKASAVKSWLKSLERAKLAASYRSALLALLSGMLNDAVEDDLIRKNPCATKSVQKQRPTVHEREIVPWPVERVQAVRDQLPDRYELLAIIGAGLGLRQGEIFGLADEDIHWLDRVVKVERQVKMVDSRLVFSPPKRGKTREVPLPESVSLLLAAYKELYPPAEVTLPWWDHEASEPSDPRAFKLLLRSREGKALNRNYVNTFVWKPALISAGVEPTRENGMHALRHHYASVLLDAGVSIKALSKYLGHDDPGFTLRKYTHLMPASGDRAGRAVDAAFAAARESSHGPETAQPVIGSA